MAEMQDVAFSQQYQIYMPFIMVSYFEDVQSCPIDICCFREWYFQIWSQSSRGKSLFAGIPCPTH